MSVDVIVPFRPDGGHRDRNWKYLRGKWEEHFPDWEIFEGACPDGPWIKALAIEDALSRSTADMLVISDSDVWTDGVKAAVDAMGKNTWAIPHTMLYRLSEKATTAFMAGEPIDPAHKTADIVERPYTGVMGGGIVVIRRKLYEDVPFDPRFAGWGGEDISAAVAWCILGGRPWRGYAPMWHLWHPPSYGPDRTICNRDLFMRYRQAARNPAKMRKIIAEFKGVSE